MISFRENKAEILKWLKSSSLSIIIHSIGFVVLTILANLSTNNPLVNPAFYTIDFNQYSQKTELIEKEDLNEKDEKNNTSTEPEEIVSEQHFSFKDINADTTLLDQIYKESTLNVSIKYPKGWVFVDQNVKNKLDGVTFWASDGLHDPPPYIHLEVKEKYYFNEQKYEYQIEFDNCTAYYNDPEIIEDYYIQNVYLRTKTSEDFNIKLMIIGEDAFKAFQPRFFGMIKTFNFGSSFF
jgi:hypothetical protein